MTPLTRGEKLRWASILFASIGLVDAGYLTWIKLAHREEACTVIGDCFTVNTSVYSEIAGVPIALLGFGAFLTILGVLALENRVELFHDYGVQIVYGLSAIGVLYSAYLTYIEIAVLEAICPFCVVSAISLVTILALTIFRLFQASTLENA